MSLLNKARGALRPSQVWSVGLLDLPTDDPFEVSTARLRHLLSSRHIRTGRRHVHTRADPFLFEHEGSLFLFIEVQETGTPGFIAAYRLSDDLMPEEFGPVLVEPHHLSYPMVFRDEHTIHLIPEASQAREVALYTFTDFPYGLKRTRVLLTGEEYVDTSVHFDGSRWWLFTGWGGGLYLYFADRLDSAFTPHPMNPVCTDPAFSRCGGPIHEWDGRRYRMGQDGRSSYGTDLSALEIVELTPVRYREQLTHPFIFRRRTGWNALGAHHLSVVRFGGRTIAAVDGKQSDYWLNKPLSLLYT